MTPALAIPVSLTSYIGSVAILAFMALQSNLFPIDQPVMPEARQIGRAGAIMALEAKLCSPAHQWLIGERRIGKTSVAKAVLARLRARGSVALDVDLSKQQLFGPEDLAGEIARQAQAARAGEALAKAKTILGIGRRQRGRVKELGTALTQLGFDDEGQALDAVAALLAGADDGSPGLDQVLGSLALHARATEHRAYLLLDEVHLLAGIETAERVVARWCHEPESPLVCILAGSEESAVRELRDEGRPLAAVGEEFELPAIGHEDWVAGLRERFDEIALKVEGSDLDAIVQASGGHPRRTMLIASRIQTSAEINGEAIARQTLVSLAIRDAEGDRSWR